MIPIQTCIYLYQALDLMPIVLLYKSNSSLHSYLNHKAMHGPFPVRAQDSAMNCAVYMCSFRIFDFSHGASVYTALYVSQTVCES